MAAAPAAAGRGVMCWNSLAPAPDATGAAWRFERTIYSAFWFQHFSKLQVSVQLSDLQSFIAIVQSSNIFVI